MLRQEDLGIDNLKIYQDDELYCFTSDAILLSRFAKVKKGDLVADFCSGSGIVGLHLYALNKDKNLSVTLFEMQKEMFDMSVKSIQLNNLQGVFTAVNSKIQDLGSEYNEKFSLIVCNPPYAKAQSGLNAQNPQIALCKSEIALTLEDLIKGISRCLKFSGRTCIVHRADRLAEIFGTMLKYNLEPKRLQVVCAKDKAPYLVLIEAVKGGKSGLNVLPFIEN